MNLTADIWTDGSCVNKRHNCGGYAAFIRYLNGGQPTVERQLYGGSFSHTTSGRMEVMAVIAAIQHLSVDCQAATIYSDSQYVVHMFTQGWIFHWEQLKWVNRQNVDLLKQLLQVARSHPAKLSFRWVRGHANCQENELVDRLAKLGGLELPVIEDLRGEKLKFTLT